MTYFEFCHALWREGVRGVDNWRKLDNLGRESAHDAHDELYKLGALDDAGKWRDYNDYQSFCAAIGRSFVLDNLDLFVDQLD